MLEATDGDALDRPEQFFFWGNLYNARTVLLVLEHWPVRSITELRISPGLSCGRSGATRACYDCAKAGTDGADDPARRLLAQLGQDLASQAASIARSAPPSAASARPAPRPLPSSPSLP